MHANDARVGRFEGAGTKHDRRMVQQPARDWAMGWVWGGFGHGRYCDAARGSRAYVRRYERGGAQRAFQGRQAQASMGCSTRFGAPVDRLAWLCVGARVWANPRQVGPCPVTRTTLGHAALFFLTAACFFLWVMIDRLIRAILASRYFDLMNTHTHIRPRCRLYLSVAPVVCPWSAASLLPAALLPRLYVHHALPAAYHLFRGRVSRMRLRLKRLPPPPPPLPNLRGPPGPKRPSMSSSS